MRSLMCLLFLVIFCSVQMTSSATFALDAAKSHCCVKFSNMKIPVNRVVSYYWTSSSCSKRAIVFKTIAGKEICVDPETAWVSGHVDKVSKRTTTATETNATTTTTATETNATTTTTATETTATESNATSTTTATKTTASESTSAASTTATTAKTQSLRV